MRRLLPCGVLGCLLLLAADARADDLQDMQGTWNFKGYAALPGLKRYQTVQVTFAVTITGNRLEMTSGPEVDLARLPADEKSVLADWQKAAPQDFFARLGPKGASGPKVTGTLKLAPGQSPKAIDLTFDVPAGAKGQPATDLGIYQFEGGALKLDLSPAGSPRPPGFLAQVKGAYLLATGTRPTK
jgi:uncharacterized protein (TIGR03067 family)